MSAREMYDYLTTIASDVDYTLGQAPYAIHPQGVITEIGTKNQEVFRGDDGLSRVAISYSDVSVFIAQLQWEILTASESGTLMDFWHNTAIGNGWVNSFKWAHPDDGHIYVVSWDCDFSRQRLAYDIYGILNIQFAVWGRIAD